MVLEQVTAFPGQRDGALAFVQRDALDEPLLLQVSKVNGFVALVAQIPFRDDAKSADGRERSRFRPIQRVVAIAFVNQPRGRVHLAVPSRARTHREGRSFPGHHRGRARECRTRFVRHEAPIHGHGRGQATRSHEFRLRGRGCRRRADRNRLPSQISLERLQFAQAERADDAIMRSRDTRGNSRSSGFVWCWVMSVLVDRESAGGRSTLLEYRVHETTHRAGAVAKRAGTAGGDCVAMTTRVDVGAVGGCAVGGRFQSDEIWLTIIST